MDLLTYMKLYEPDELVRTSAHDYRTKTHGSLVISDNGLWRWCKEGIGGKTALNYLIEIKGMSFVEAIQHLTNAALPVISVFQPVTKEPKEKQPFVLPARDRSNRKAAEYLQRRGINSKVLRFCYENRLLYQSNHNGIANCVFVGKDATGQAQSAVLRGCGGSYRGNISGSDKQYGFCIPAEMQECATVEVYESPIDAMSGASLRTLNGSENWRSVHYLAMGGLNYLAVDQFLRQNPHTKNIMLCVDNDEAGHIFREKFIPKYQALGFEVTAAPPPKGKDYNDYLVMCRKEKHSREER